MTTHHHDGTQESAAVDTIDNFSTLCASIGLDIRLRKAVSRLGFVQPTLVQSKCLPLAISSGKDLLVRARTGSGKTLAYCLPLLQKILVKKKQTLPIRKGENGFVQGLILVPTRELCSQVSKVLQSLMYFCEQHISLAVLTASATRKDKNVSAAVDKQEAMLRDRPDILVSTPASLLTHLHNGGILQNTLRLSVETVVIDEADLVLSFGYSDDITEIIKFLPNIFQGFLMSATLSPELESLKKLILHSPVILRLEEEEEALAAKGGGGSMKQGLLTQFYLSIPKKDKLLVLYVFLKLGLLKGKGLFFVNTTDGGYRLKLFLEQFHIQSAVLNAELPLNSRLNIIEQFNVGNFDYLIATDESTSTDHSTSKYRRHSDDVETQQGDENDSDVNDAPETDMDRHENQKKRKRQPQRKKKDMEYGFSRGLDFRGVSFVVNFDFPTSPSSYTHRIGRTARGGAKGVALSFVESESMDQHTVLSEIQKDQPSLPIDHALASPGTLRGSTKFNADEESSFVPPTNPQPTPLDFDLSEIEGFRYRVEDVSRSVTKVAIRETRAAELRAEIINSQRLQSHFEENKADLQLLRHDRLATHISKVQDHLKYVIIFSQLH